MENLIKHLETLKYNKGRKYLFHFHKWESESVITIMLNNGKALARIYWFEDDNKRAYLNYLSVNNDVRNQGIGTELQEIREYIALRLGFKYCYLWVEKYTWMRKWYARRNYKYYCKHKKQNNSMWLRKCFNKGTIKEAIEEYAQQEIENFNILDISKRELLITYEKNRGKTILIGDTDAEIVDEVLNNL